MYQDNPARRTVLATVGTLCSGALAGCSNNTSSPPESTESQPESSKDETGSPEQNSSNSGSDDTVYDGEEDFEEWLSSHETDAVPDNHWMEFEDPGSQFELPLTESVRDERFTYNVEEGKVGEGIGEFDSLYFAVSKEGEGELQFAPGYFMEDEWDSSLSADENMREMNHLFLMSYEPVSEDGLESFFRENVEGYSDVSDDMPQEYLDLVE